MAVLKLFTGDSTRAGERGFTVSAIAVLCATMIQSLFTVVDLRIHTSYSLVTAVAAATHASDCAGGGEHDVRLLADRGGVSQ